MPCTLLAYKNLVLYDDCQISGAGFLGLQILYPFEKQKFLQSLTSFSVGLWRTVCSVICDFTALEILESVLIFHNNNFCKFHVLYHEEVTHALQRRDGDLSQQSHFQSLRSPSLAVGKRGFESSQLKITKEITKFHLHLWHMPEMVAPRALVFRLLVRRNEDSGNEIGLNEKKLVRQSQIVQSAMYSYDTVIITQFVYNS